MCLEGVCKMSEGVWKVSGTCLHRVLNILPHTGPTWEFNLTGILLGQVRSIKDSSSKDILSQDRSSQDKAGRDRSSHDRSNQDRSSQEIASQDSSGQLAEFR